MNRDLLQIRAEVAMWACIVNANITFWHNGGTVAFWLIGALSAAIVARFRKG